jgi:hypothetical protein
MPTADETVHTYRELAECYERQGQAQMRDRFLVLAADAALIAGHGDEADRLRNRLLQVNPHHLLKPYASFAEAMKSADVQNYISALRRSHPYEKAEHLLEEMRQNVSGVKKVAQNPPPKEAPKPEEEPQVFRVRESEEEPKTVPSRVRSMRPQPAAPKEKTSATPARPAAPPPPAVTRPAPAADVFPLRPQEKLLPPRAPAPDDSEDREAGGTWVAAGLFWLVLISGVLAAGYSLGRPFLPPGWLP